MPDMDAKLAWMMFCACAIGVVVALFTLLRIGFRKLTGV